jgi:hypothetical protein
MQVALLSAALLSAALPPAALLSAALLSAALLPAALLPAVPLSVVSLSVALVLVILVLTALVPGVLEASGPSEASDRPCPDGLAATDSRGRADDIRPISAGALPIPSMIEYRFVHVKCDNCLHYWRFSSYSDC